MKTKAILRIVLLSLVALVLTGILLAGLLVGTYMFHLGSSGGTVVENEGQVDAAQIRSIEIDWAAGSVDIRPGDTEQIIFAETLPENSQYHMTYKVQGDTLILSYSSGFSIGFGITLPDKDLTVTVPQDWVCEALEIDGASLDITVHGLTVETLSLDGASCNMEFTGSVRNVDVDGASANILLNCTDRVSSIDVDGASCDLKLVLPKNCGFLLQMDGLSCDFHSNLDYSVNNHDYLYGDRYCRMDIDGLSCDVTISEQAE